MEAKIVELARWLFRFNGPIQLVWMVRKIRRRTHLIHHPLEVDGVLAVVLPVVLTR